MCSLFPAKNLALGAPIYQKQPDVSWLVDGYTNNPSPFCTDFNLVSDGPLSIILDGIHRVFAIKIYVTSGDGKMVHPFIKF